MKEIYLNGEFVAESEARVSVFDRGFLFADGVYEAIPVYHRIPFLFDRHYKRLCGSLEAIGIPFPMNEQEWMRVFRRLLDSTPSENASIYIQVTRGTQHPRQHAPADNMTPTVLVTVSPMELPEQLASPVKIEPVEDIRWLRCDIKSISLLGNILLKQEAMKHGAAEPLLHRAGRVTEGAACNYFIVEQEQLRTPPADQLILSGITREWVIELARKAGMKVSEEAFSLAEVYNADECFLTSSTREIVPVTQAGEHQIGNGKPGPVTKRLAELFRAQRPQ